MIIPDKKTAMLILAGLDKGGKDVPPAPAPQDEMKMIAEDILEAVKKNSAEDLAAALKAAWSACEACEPEEE